MVKLGNNGIEIGYLFWAFFSSLCNMLFYKHAMFSLGIMVLQVGILFILFLKNNYLEYLCYYIIFISTSLEAPYYYGVENIYGFKGFRLLGISISTWCLLPLLFVTYLNRKKWRELLHDKKNSSLNFVVKAIWSLCIISIFVGLMNFLIADNGLSKYDGAWKAFLEEIYSIMLYLMIPLYILFYFVKVKQEYISKIKKCLYAVLMGIVFVQIVAVVFNIKGTMWESPILVTSLVACFTPYLFLLYFVKDREYREKPYVYGILGVGGLVLSFKYTFSSGGILIIMCMLLLILLLLIKQKQYQKFLMYLILAITMVLVLVFVISQSNTLSGLLEYKLEQVLSVFKIWDENWLKSMPNSAKVRFIELYNILIEYKRKPQYIFFGKGIFGSVKDYSGLIKTMYVTHGSGFTDIEWRSGCYFSLHETINALFLSNGLLGIGLIGYILKKVVEGIEKSPLLGLGFVWFIFYYNYSVTLSMFGMCCLMVGLLEWDMRKEI